MLYFNIEIWLALDLSKNICDTYDTYYGRFLARLKVFLLFIDVINRIHIKGTKKNVEGKVRRVDKSAYRNGERILKYYSVDFLKYRFIEITNRNGSSSFSPTLFR